MAIAIVRHKAGRDGLQCGSHYQNDELTFPIDIVLLRTAYRREAGRIAGRKTVIDRDVNFVALFLVQLALLFALVLHAPIGTMVHRPYSCVAHLKDNAPTDGGVPQLRRIPGTAEISAS
jgi:hypothetical protein